MNTKKIDINQLQKENEERLNNIGTQKLQDFDIFDNIDIFDELSKTIDELDESEVTAQNTSQVVDTNVASELLFENLQSNKEEIIGELEADVVLSRTENKLKNNAETNTLELTQINSVVSEDLKQEQTEITDVDTNVNNEEVVFNDSKLTLDLQKVFQIKNESFYTNGNSILLFVYEDELLAEFFNLGFKDEDINKNFGVINKINTLGNSEFTNIYFVGLGKQKELDESKISTLFKKLAKELDEDVNVDFITWQYTNKKQLVEIITREFCQSKYKVNKISKKQEQNEKTNKLYLALSEDYQQIIDEATISAHVMKMAKDLMYLPSNVLTPDVYVEYIKKEVTPFEKVKIDIKNTQDLLDEDFGLITAVNQGSDKNAYLVTLEYNGINDISSYKTIVGKGITFDTGGYSLKPVNSMLEMHTDMGGSAIALASFIATCMLELKINLRCVLVITENVVNGHAYKVEDVLISKSGKTVQVKSTDAEGRLVLADALTHAQSFETDEIITIATLTASNYLTDYDIVPIFSNSNELTNELVICGEQTQDFMWPMPLNHFNGVLSKKVDSSSVIADCANKSTKAGSPMIYGANFIYSFVEEKDKTHFAHLDIGGQVSQNQEFTTPTLNALIAYYISLQEF